MNKEEIIKTLRDMAKYPTVTMPRDTEALRNAADLLEQAQQAEPVAWINGWGDLFKNPDEAERGQTMRPLYASPPPRQPEQCQCPECKVVLHASDCAVHSEPAYPKGECNCGATKPEPIGHADLGINNIYIFNEMESRTVPKGRTPLYTAPQKQPPVIDKSVARRIASQLGWEPPRQPLTDEEIKQIWLNGKDHGDDWLDVQAIARAIEAAHGIKGEA